jgi:hypothetical protein
MPTHHELVWHRVKTQCIHSLYGQHGPAAALGEPYVYSYKFDDRDDLLDKLNRAMSNPIQR